ncbi:MAG: hypothetical protein GXO98_03845 [Nitrospirae bacterium]|nr:hypothetical protein [Nitrospirota bacterium]
MVSKNICIFEDDRSDNLLPLVYLRPVFELRCGMSSLREKIEQAYPESKVHIVCRGYLSDTVKEQVSAASVNDAQALGEEDCLFLNGRILARSDLSKNIPLNGPEEVGVQGETVVYARLKSETVKKVLNDSGEDLTRLSAGILKGIPETKEIDVLLISYPWDLVKHNAEAIKDDYQALGGGRVEGFLDERVAIYGDKSQLYVGEGARIVEAGVVLNLEEGPIYIDKKAKIRAFSIIDGPAFVGESAIIDGAKLREGCSIGKVCRIGGELEESILQAYSNKHHDGFLGHAYVGEWVNLGAIVTNSDLKNNYGEVKLYVKGELINSGEIKVGCFIADHTKVGIGTFLNTGTVIGVAANVFGGGLPPKYLPSFSWGGGKEFVEHDPEKAIANAKKIMARRKVEQSPAEAALLRKVYEMTAEEREAAGIGNAKNL